MNQKAFLVGADLGSFSGANFFDHMQELELLSKTAGYDIVKVLSQKVSKINSSLYLGSGKVDEILNLAKYHNVKYLIFDNELTPAQSKNINKKYKKITVIDRADLILQIFMKHAKTRESKVQVELAQLQYLLPRLTRAWTHLERQMGGIGSRAGAGETQIEVDRRLLRDRISKLRNELTKIEKNRITRTKKRVNSYKVALVGYTNAGKSTLMKSISGADVLIKDQLFATLDTTVRSVNLDKYNTILLSDTVGFVRKLPHHLVASFKSTLNEVVDADLILIVLDSSSDQVMEHYKVIKEVLNNLNANTNDYIVVLNKIDQIDNHKKIQNLNFEFPNAIFISALNSLRIEELKLKIIEFMEKNYKTVNLKLPYSNSKNISLIQNSTFVISRKYKDEYLHIKAKGPIGKIDSLLKLLSK